jgi:hypothetical protein
VDPLHRPVGLTVSEMCVEEEVRVESSVYGRFWIRISDVWEWNQDRRHQDTASRTLKVPSLPSDAPESAGRQLHRCLSRWSLFRNRVH